MSICATIYNADMVPLTDGVEVSDDAEFEPLETQAAELASGECTSAASAGAATATARWRISRMARRLQPQLVLPSGPPGRNGRRAQGQYLPRTPTASPSRPSSGKRNVSEGIRIALAKLAE